METYTLRHLTEAYNGLVNARALTTTPDATREIDKAIDSVAQAMRFVVGPSKANA